MKTASNVHGRELPLCLERLRRPHATSIKHRLILFRQRAPGRVTPDASLAQLTAERQHPRTHGLLSARTGRSKKKHVGQYINDMLIYPSKPGSVVSPEPFLSCAPSGNPYTHIIPSTAHMRMISTGDADGRTGQRRPCTRPHHRHHHTGRKTGQLHRTELWFHYIDGHVYITGTPGVVTGMPTCWRTPIHVSSQAEHQSDLPARATPILDRARRRWIIARIDQKLAALEIWTHGLRWSVGRGGTPRRVSWRMIKDGVEAHMAIVDITMVRAIRFGPR